MKSPTTLNDLHLILKSANPADMLDASWEAFDLGQRTADEVVWKEGFDEVLALSAAQACSAGQALLPLPRNGEPLPLPDRPEESVSACAALLRSVHRALVSLSRASDGGAAHHHNVQAAAERAKEAADALRALRTDEACP